MYYNDDEARMINFMATSSGYDYRNHNYIDSIDREINNDFNNALDDAADMYLKLFGETIF